MINKIVSRTLKSNSNFPLVNCFVTCGSNTQPHSFSNIVSFLVGDVVVFFFFVYAIVSNVYESLKCKRRAMLCRWNEESTWE